MNFMAFLPTTLSVARHEIDPVSYRRRVTGITLAEKVSRSIDKVVLARRL
jgi:hypothetical protein